MCGEIDCFLSHSHTPVSGLAADLVALVLSAIKQFGSFEMFLLAAVLVGILQLIAGVAKGGIVANDIPSNVIKDLLAAIGFTLILKKTPHTVGFDNDTEAGFTLLMKDYTESISVIVQ